MRVILMKCRKLITFLVFYGTESLKWVHRKETYTWTDFLAVCGGLLGLLLGISALSIIELVYYSTLRLFWTFRRLKSEANVQVHVQPCNREIIIVKPIETNNNSLDSSI